MATSARVAIHQKEFALLGVGAGAAPGNSERCLAGEVDELLSAGGVVERADLFCLGAGKLA